LIVLRTIRSVDERRFVPSLAVVFGILLAIIGTGVLIHFVHHIASSLQASTIIARVARDTLAALDNLFPDALGEEAPRGAGRAPEYAASVHDWHPVLAGTTGYVQSVDETGLLEAASADRQLVRMERGVGDFVVEGMPIASIALVTSPASPPVGSPVVRELDTHAHRVAAAFTIGAHRTVEQDVAFGIRQLVDVALRALSPGINDTTTAIHCIDYLGAILLRLPDLPPRPPSLRPTASPNSDTSPALGRTMPRSIRMVVVLPAPFRPRNA
jgi:uncharacterized membrane protein